MTPSNKCLVEMRQLSFLAKDYLAKGDAAKAKELRDRAEALANCGLSNRRAPRKVRLRASRRNRRP